MTVDVKQFEPGQIVNLIYDTEALAQESRVVVQGYIGFAQAQKTEDVRVKHSNIYSTLVSKPENKIEKSLFLLYTDSNNKLHVAADVWLREVKIIKNLQVNFTVTLDNRDELDLMTKALAARGFSDVKYDIVDNTAG
ncbi:hypothetical protein WELLINGTON_27 [Erwinia phage Wellington]|jgi:hypothetical protein|uniref:SH3 fold domain-containing protein n=2 Tax=Wellingtonvirus wellington TaxID=2734153 RepID=A0A1B2IDP7_9CAUD|nr:hypothetical protein BIZ80_gp272 [Erwinia phage vB_EamM_Kwan]YP_009806511.1 hypothetical protein HOT70_gp274 [Erwinia phage Wellington]ANZ49379.1 hypothetical protein KWAN_27 [Erwinia phage vB_EamM_Kwan]AXF51158.1 hypothetical protein WELLINGTON_27 [Erwinia phage Wellington]